MTDPAELSSRAPGIMRRDVMVRLLCNARAEEKQKASDRAETVERISPDVGLRCWLALGISWSRSEDETIVRSVSELGNKWAKIVAGPGSALVGCAWVPSGWWWAP